MSYQWPDDRQLAFSLLVVIDDGDGIEPVDARIQYGLRTGIGRITELIDEYGIKAGFAASARLFAGEPQLVDYIRQRGHEALLGATEAGTDAEVAQIGRAIARMQTFGAPVHGIYPNDGEVSTHSHAPLASGGVRYLLAESADEAPSWGNDGNLIVLPCMADCSDRRFESNECLSPDVWLQYLIDTLDVLYSEGVHTPRLLTVTIHPHLIGRPGRINALEQLLQYVTSKDDVWVAPPGQVAAHFTSVRSFHDHP